MAYIPVTQRTGGVKPKPTSPTPPALQAKSVYVPVAAHKETPAPLPADSGGMFGDFSTLGQRPVITQGSTPAMPAGPTAKPLGLLKDVGQAVARSVASAGLTIAKKIDPKAETLAPEDFKSFFGQALVETVFGKDPNKAIEDRIAEAEPKLKAWGEDLQKLAATPGLSARERLVAQTLADLATKHPKTLAFTGIMGSVGLDLTPFGGSQKAAYRAMIQARNEIDALGALTKLGVEEDVARRFFPEVIKATTEKEAKALLDNIVRFQATTKPGAAGARGAYVPIAERAGQIARETPGVRVAEDAAPLAPRVNPTLRDEVVPGRGAVAVKGVPTEVRFEPIVREVAKYNDPGAFTERIKDLVTKRKAGIKLLDHQEDFLQVLRSQDFAGLKPSEIFDRFKKSSVPEIKTTARVNTKLEKMATDSPTFGDFYKRSDLTLEALNATAKSKGYTNATDFYAKNGPVADMPARRALDSETASLERVAAMPRTTRENLPDLPRLAPGRLAEETTAAREALEEARTQRDIGREVVPDMPGKAVRKYESAQTGDLPEVTGREFTKRGGKKVKTSAFGRSGDTIVQDLGFTDVEEADEALKEYKRAREQLNAAEKSVSARVKDYRDRKAVFDEVVRYVQQEGKARREKVKLVQDFFKLDNGDVKDLLKGERDVRLMTDGEFNDFLKRFEGKATESYLRMQDLVDLKATIFEKEFVKLDNLRQAMKLPTIEHMTPEQMQQFTMALKEFEAGDEFLGVRQLETVKNTTLDGIHTMREARERALMDINIERDRHGLPRITAEELASVKVGWLDKYRYDVALARQHPLYELMVRDTHAAFLGADMRVLEVKDRVNELFIAARKSRPRSTLGRLIPTDDHIFKWLESSDAQKILMAKDMTKEELEAAMYVRAWYAEARDYLVQQGVLKRYRSDYVTHVRRGFLEGWHESTKSFKPSVSGEKGPGLVKRTSKGLLAAFKEAFSAYKQDEAFFTIMNEKTGDVLPLEKFFQFSLTRSGELIPTKNVARAFLRYASTFEKKKALDSIVPKLDIYVHSLSPQKLTPRGLALDDSLKRFFKSWMNTKKGRPTDLRFLTPGDKLDWGLRTGVALTRMLDLGLSIPVGLASNVGAQAAAFVNLGAKKYAIGASRLVTKEGRAFTAKYKNLVGESVFEKIKSADSTLGDNLLSGIFGLFSFADRKARQEVLLGLLTKEEFAAGEISARRLAEIEQRMGRALALPGMESVIGKTALGKVGTQYKTWAVPLLSSTLDDLEKLYRAGREGTLGAFIRSQEGGELLRTTLLSAVVGLGVYGIVNDDTPMKDKDFAEKVVAKVARDALSSVGALDPLLWLSEPRLMKIFGDLGLAAHQIITLDANKSGELMGPKTLKRTITPGVIKQLIPPEETAEPASSGGGLPGLPKLPKIGGGLPKLPKIR